MICFDISNRQTFNNISHWYDAAKRQNNKGLNGLMNNERNFARHETGPSAFKIGGVCGKQGAGQKAKP